MKRDCVYTANNIELVEWSKENWIIIGMHRQTKYRDGLTPGI